MHCSDLNRRAFLAGIPLALAGCAGLESVTEPSERADHELTSSSGTFDAGIRFTDIARREESAFSFRRGRNDSAVAQLAALKDQGSAPLAEVRSIDDTVPGDYGIAIFDSNGDGTLDIFVPNVAGEPHHFYRNKLAETGELEFEEVAETVGLSATDQTGQGVAVADIDNDGSREVIVLTAERGQRHRFFDNNGDGTFTDISADVDIKNRGGRICSVGDIDNDGLVDLVIGTEDAGNDVSACFTPYEGAAQNRLFKNLGDNQFREISEQSGIRDLEGVPEGGGTRTHGIAMVDIDHDGHIEILQGDDQCGVPAEDTLPGDAGEDWGQVHIFDNDGTGSFTDMMTEYNLTEYSVLSNMGFAFGDFNYDGHLDWLTTAYGDYMSKFKDEEYDRGAESTQWFIQKSDGTFETPGVGRLVATPFGWGTAAFDYDNDGLTDLVYHGGATHGNLYLGDNPGVVLHGHGHASFTFDEAAATSSGTDHRRRAVYGVAIGDLNNDGYPDIVTASNEDVAPDSDLQDCPVEFGGPFDDHAMYNYLYEVSEDGEHADFTGFDRTTGSLSVEINDGETDNGWVAVKPRGTVEATPEGVVNRDGIGAIISCTPANTERTATVPVTAGSSFASCHSLEKTFGLGDSEHAQVDILWPGGVKNRLYAVESEERLVFPEIPYSYTSSLDPSRYRDSVQQSLTHLEQGDVITSGQVDRFLDSAVRAFEEEND